MLLFIIYVKNLSLNQIFNPVLSVTFNRRVRKGLKIEIFENYVLLAPLEFPLHPIFYKWIYGSDHRFVPKFLILTK